MTLFYYFLLLVIWCNINGQCELCFNDTSCEVFENSTDNILTDFNVTLNNINETETEQTTEEVILTTESISNSTSTSTTITTISTTITKPPHKTIPTNKEMFIDVDKICTCDQQPNSCDINCCCDDDCSYNEKQIFKECIEMPGFSFDNRYCYQSQLIYSNNTKYLMVKNNNGLFCIVNDNIKKHLVYPNRLIIREEKLLDKLIKRKKIYQWNQDNFYDKLFNTTNHYRIGNPIWIIKNHSLVTFQIPSRFGGIYCQSFNTINFLEEKDYSCVLSVNSKICSNEIIDANTYFYNKSIIASPTLFNITQNFNLSQCSNISCLPIKSHYCSNIYNNSIENCTETNTFPKPVYNIYCKNRVEKVLYILHHNGTKGLTNASVYIWLTNSSSEHIKLKLGVQFIWVSHKTAIFKKSGSPGYRIGAPILAGQKIVQSIGDMDFEAIALPEDPVHWLTFPKGNFQGVCDPKHRIQVTFGENRRIACNLDIVNKTCEEIHKLALYLLNVNEEERFVASYGDSSIHMTGDWVPIKRLTPIPVSPSNKEICLLPLTSLHLDIVWAKIGSFYNPQAKIIGVAQRFASGATSHSKYPYIVASVNFIEVTRPAKTEFAQLPVYEMKLPHDFFYPFFSKTSLSSKVSPSRTFILILIYFYYIHILV